MTSRRDELEAAAREPENVARLVTVNGNTVLAGADVEIALNGAGTTIAIIGNSIVTQCVPYATTNTRWAPATAKTVGNAVAPLSYKGVLRSLKYVCTVAGTTASGYGSEPVWPTTVGGTVVDGTVTWEAQADGDLNNNEAGDYWFWAQARSGQRLREVYMAGLSGRKWADIAQLEDAVLASGAGIVFMPSVFANDIWAASAGTAADVQAAWDSYEAFCDRMRLRGKKLWITTELPNGNIDSNGTAFTGYLASRGGTKLWYWINDKLRAYALRHADTVRLIDFANAYRDTNPANPVWPDNATTFTTIAGGTQKYCDAIHPYTPGAWKLSDIIVPVIEADIPEVDHFGNGAGSLYDEDPNPANYGTAGTDGTGVTGDVANSLTMVAYGTGGAITASKVARNDKAGSWNRAVYTATSGDNADLSWYVAAASAILAAGDIAEAITEFRVTANPTGFSYPKTNVRFFGATNPQWVYAGGLTSADAELGQFITQDMTFTLRTPGFVVPSGFTGESLYVKGQSRAVAANFTLDFGRRVLRKMTTPALA